MHRIVFCVVVSGALGAAACEENAQSTASASSPVRLESAPEELQPKVKAARRAMNDLGTTLVGRLQKALVDQGTEAAIDVCAEVAQPLTKKVVREHGIELGRTSHKLRNPDNAPRPWVKPWLEQHAGKPAEAVDGAVYDLGDRLGVIEPIGTKGICVTCHGKNISPSLGKTIAEHYPRDQATGFEIGQLRGAFWAEIDKE